MFHLASPIASFLRQLLHPVANDPRPFMLLLFCSPPPPLLLLFFIPPPPLSTNVVMKNKSTFPSSDTLLNYLIPFCIVGQSVSGSTWYIDTLGKCRENVYVRSLFPIFWKSEALNCSRFKSVLVLSYIIFYYLLLLLLSYYKRNLL